MITFHDNIKYDTCKLIIDKFDDSYVSYQYIHRGKKGLQKTNAIEKRHRRLALKYRIGLVKGRFRKLYKQWTFDMSDNFKQNKYDLIINCGALSEAILSQHFKCFTQHSIVSGFKNIKTFFPDTPCLHISSSMVYGTWEDLIDEQYSLGSVDLYGSCKIEAEKALSKTDVCLRPIHVYGMGDGKFPIWMNIERQIAINKPVLVEKAGCIYIKDFVLSIKNIIDKWNPGAYNISYDFTRDPDAIKAVYPKSFETKAFPSSSPLDLNCKSSRAIVGSVLVKICLSNAIYPIFLFVTLFLYLLNAVGLSEILPLAICILLSPGFNKLGGAGTLEPFAFFSALALRYSTRLISASVSLLVSKNCAFI